MKTPKSEKPVRKSEHPHLAHDAEGAASGAVVGAAVGAMAGPVGVVAGALLGAAAGALAVEAMGTEADRRAAHDAELDEEIGVTGGDLGAPNLKHPPAKVGAPSAAAAGVGATAGTEPAEGPMQTPED
jgi:phage tail tape-measure protein